MELKVKCRRYRHQGIHAGKRRVIHYAGWPHRTDGLIKEGSLEQFIEGRSFSIGPRPTDPSSGAEIVPRARSRLGEQCYGVLRNDCKHFCNWCHIRELCSAQVEALSKPEFLLDQLLQDVRSRVRSQPPVHVGQTLMA